MFCLNRKCLKVTTTQQCNYYHELFVKLLFKVDLNILTSPKSLKAEHLNKTWPICRVVTNFVYLNYLARVN